MLTNSSQFLLALFSLSLFSHSLYKRNELISLTINKDENFFFLLAISTVTLYIVILQRKDRRISSSVSFLMALMFIIFFILFLAINMIVFYIFFELSVVPLMLFISYWGYSLERVKSLLYIFLYTFRISFPFFVIIVFIRKTSSFQALIFPNSIRNLNALIVVIASTFMLVKVPLWALHIWLIKAHVEASTEGSIVLASVVLKLAGIAFIKIPLILPSISLSITSLVRVILTFGALGVIIMAFYTMRQRDLKLIIAVSSIIHIIFMLVLYYGGHSINLWALLLIIVSHGLVSPLIFLFIGNIYDQVSTRRSSLIKGILKSLLFISIIWFFLTVFNIAVPLSINFIAEIYFFFSSITYRYILTSISLCLVFLNGLFNIYLYVSMVSGQNRDYFYQMIPAEKTYLYYSVISVAAVLILLSPGIC